MKLMEFDGPGEMSPDKDCQVTFGNSNDCNDAIVCVLIGSEGGDWFILMWLLREGRSWLRYSFCSKGRKEKYAVLFSCS